MKKVLAVVAVVFCMSMGLTGCTTASFLGGAGGGHGLFSGFGVPGVAGAEASEIGSYSTWLGLFDAGYSEYADAVKKAVADGKVVTSTSTWCIIFVKNTAYAK